MKDLEKLLKFIWNIIINRIAVLIVAGVLASAGIDLWSHSGDDRIEINTNEEILNQEPTNGSN